MVDLLIRINDHHASLVERCFSASPHVVAISPVLSQRVRPLNFVSRQFLQSLIQVLDLPLLPLMLHTFNGLRLELFVPDNIRSNAVFGKVEIVTVRAEGPIVEVSSVLGHFRHHGLDLTRFQVDVRKELVLRALTLVTVLRAQLAFTLLDVLSLPDAFYFIISFLLLLSPGLWRNLELGHQAVAVLVWRSLESLHLGELLDGKHVAFLLLLRPMAGTPSVEAVVAQPRVILHFLQILVYLDLVQDVLAKELLRIGALPGLVDGLRVDFATRDHVGLGRVCLALERSRVHRLHVHLLLGLQLPLLQRRVVFDRRFVHEVVRGVVQGGLLERMRQELVSLLPVRQTPYRPV